jgi:hypothetical protein
VATDPVAQLVRAVTEAPTWDERVALVRQVPEQFGTAQHRRVYSAIAKEIYVPHLAPNFAYVHQLENYSLEHVEAAYVDAHTATMAFNSVSVDDLTSAIRGRPRSLLIFRLLLGFSSNELAAATALIEELAGLPRLSASRIGGIEDGRKPPEAMARCCAEVIDKAMTGTLFPAPTGELHSKMEKPDTEAGWNSVRAFAERKVPFPMYLHQRLVGGSWRQLLDATSEKRGDLLEDAVEELFQSRDVRYVRTGSHNQGEIVTRFNITIRPAPDFVIHDEGDALRAMLECKGASDGGTARDKADRFDTLHSEGIRLGGVPVFAVLGGLGWTRTSDALGPVVENTDGRVFMLPNLAEMLTVQPFPSFAK